MLVVTFTNAPFTIVDTGVNGGQGSQPPLCIGAA
jgi:hypothetical protein